MDVEKYKITKSKYLKLFENEKPTGVYEIHMNVRENVMLSTSVAANSAILQTQVC